MLNRSSGSRCSRAARPCAIGTGRSSRLRHFRRERTRRRLEGCSQIDGGLVRLSHFPSLTSCDVFEELCSCLARFLVFFLAGNTRVISQTALDHFRTSLQTKQHDPYSVLLRRNKLPMQLLDDAANPNLRKVCHQLLLVFKPVSTVSDQRKCSALISSKRSHLQILSVPRPCENARASMLARSRSLVS